VEDPKSEDGGKPSDFPKPGLAAYACEPVKMTERPKTELTLCFSELPKATEITAGDWPNRIERTNSRELRIVCEAARA
jgi:hypothetical protein